MRKLIKHLINYTGFDIVRKTGLKPATRSSMKMAIEWLRNNKFDIKTVLDVGASDGRWSKECMIEFADVHYVLFEPQICHSSALDLLKDELKDNITVIKKAVGEKSGITYFDTTDPFGGALISSQTENSVEVGLTSVDDSIKEIGQKGPYLLKLDTHGFEIPILEGAVNTLKDCSALIIESYNYNIEPGSVTFWQLCEYLNRKGFRPIDIVDLMYREHDNSLWQMDIVFIKESWQGFDYISYR